MGVTDLLVPLVLSAVGVANALVEWLTTYAIHSTLLIGGTWLLLATPAGRRLSPAGTAWLWRFALVGGIASASLQVFRTAEPLGGTWHLGRTAQARAIVRVQVDRPVTIQSAGGAEVVRPGSRDGHVAWSTGTLPSLAGVQATIDLRPRWVLGVLAAWVALGVLLTALFIRARRRFFGMLGLRRDAANTLAGGALRAVRAQAGVTRPITLTLSEGLTSPVALGSSEICLPERALAELDPIRMESILAHELAHLERRDPLWLTFARLAEAIFFFQPLNRLARVRMQEAAEFASDGWAAGVVARPLDLAHCLARVAEWTVDSTRLLAPAMAERRGGVLVRRVQRLTGTTPSETEVNLRGLRLMGVTAVLGLVLLAPRALVGGPVLPSGASRGAGGVFMLRVDSTAAGRGTLLRSQDVRIVRISPAP